MPTYLLKLSIAKPKFKSLSIQICDTYTSAQEQREGRLQKRASESAQQKQKTSSGSSGSPQTRPCISLVGASLSETHMMRSTGISSVCLSVGMFTFRIYSCSNSTTTHAQNLCTRCVYELRVATCACRSSTGTSRSAWVSVENKNKPVSLPIVVTMCTVGGRLPTIWKSAFEAST